VRSRGAGEGEGEARMTGQKVSGLGSSSFDFSSFVFFLKKNEEGQVVGLTLNGGRVVVVQGCGSGLCRMWLAVGRNL
jgi:hypothetical protein